MLVVYDHSLSGRLGTLLSALIVIHCIVGLTMHRDFYAGKPRRDFFCFYTNLSNLLVLIYFALIAPRLYAQSACHLLIPGAEFSVMMSIMLTFCVFHCILFPAIRNRISQMPRTREYYIVAVDNLIIHYLVPLLVFAYWVFCSPGKQQLMPYHAVYWTLFPLAYGCIMLFRAQSGRIIEETSSPFPYPFLDYRALGMRSVAYTSIRLYSLCLYAGIAVITCVRFVSAAVQILPF